MDYALPYYKSIGIATEQSYQYTDRDGSYECASPSSAGRDRGV